MELILMIYFVGVATALVCFILDTYFNAEGLNIRMVLQIFGCMWLSWLTVAVVTYGLLFGTNVFDKVLWQKKGTLFWRGD